MKYQKPICDCGNELVYAYAKLYHEEFKITNKGLPQKRKNDFYDTLEDVWRERLQCPICEKFYDVDYDNKGRFVRGNLMKTAND